MWWGKDAAQIKIHEGVRLAEALVEGGSGSEPKELTKHFPRGHGRGLVSQAHTACRDNGTGGQPLQNCLADGPACVNHSTPVL